MKLEFISRTSGEDKVVATVEISEDFSGITEKWSGDSSIGMKELVKSLRNFNAASIKSWETLPIRISGDYLFVVKS